MSAQTRGAVAVGRTFFQTGVSPVQKEEEKNTGGQKNINPAPAAARCHVRRAEASAVPSPMFVSCRRVMSAQTQGTVAAERTFFPGVSPVRENKQTPAGKKHRPTQLLLWPAATFTAQTRAPYRHQCSCRVGALCLHRHGARWQRGESFFLAAAWLAAWYDFLKLRATSRTLRQPSFWEPQPGTFITSIF